MFLIIHLFYYFASLLWFIDYLSVGHQCCAQGRKDCRCQDHLHWPHRRSGGRFLAPSSRITFWISGWWPQTHDVSGLNTIIECDLLLVPDLLFLTSPRLLFLGKDSFYLLPDTVGTLGPTTPPSPAMQWTPTQLRWTACHSIRTASSSWPPALQTRSVHCHTGAVSQPHSVV